MEKARSIKKQWMYVGAGLMAGLFAGFLIFGRSGESASDRAGVSESEHDHASQDQMWTCSMHPQIMQPEPGDCPICGMDLIPSGTANGEPGIQQIRMTENAMALANIRTTRVGSEAQSADGSISLSGKITENEEANRVQVSYFDGRIEQLFATYEGQQIRQGEPLAMLYAPNLVAAQQELLTAAPLKASQPALYQAVRNKLKNWKLTDKQIDQIEQDGTAKETFPVYANVSGTVTELLTSEGDFVKAGQPIARLSNLGTVWAELDAYESQLDQFRIGQQLSLTTKAYPDLKLEARISFIDPVLDQNKRTVTIRATLQNREGLLKPGMFVWANIPSKTGTREVPLTIPASAVMWTGKRSLVYVKEHPDQPVFAMREVTLGSRTADSFVVVSGLEAGEEIVTNGTFTVDAAAQLQGKKSMMNQRSSEEDFIVIDPLDEEFVAQLKVTAQSYFELKDALVDSDQEAAVKIASKMAENLRKIDTDTRPDQVEALQNMREHLTALEAASSIDQQRVHFQRISEALISMARPLGSADQPIYLQYCPMANQNKGAYWLSLESDIKNPYYGEAMLRCGEVRATWLGER